MIEMESSEYGDRCYSMALLVTDLYSQFVFGRALADTADSSLLVRHLMDIFGAFAPPGIFCLSFVKSITFFSSFFNFFLHSFHFLKILIES